MKDDTIRRQAAIDVIEDFPHGCVWNVESMEDMADRIKALPSAQPEVAKDTNVPSNDCISRQAAIELIERMKPYHQDADDIAEMIANMSSAQPGWIPCSERLPDNNRQVLVYARSVHFVLAKYDEMREADGTYKMQWVTFDAWKPFYKIKEVIAWMELPKPWEGGQS